MSLADTLSWAVTAGFVAVGVASVASWLRSRERVTLYLAAALALLGFISLVGQINEATGYRYHLLQDISLVGFLASGYLLLLFRHSFLPVSPRVLAAVALAAVGAGTLAVVAHLPSTMGVENLDALDSVAVALVLAIWAGCAGEPTVRFWMASRTRPPVQRSRLRALSAGYTGIFLILIFSVAAAPRPDSAVSVGLNLFALVLVPMLYVSFAPPSWLRRAWREREEDTIGFAQNLAIFAPDRETIATRALERSLRLVGAEAGFIRDADGSILSKIHLSDESIEEIESLYARTVTERLIVNRTSHAFVIPLDPDGEGARMTVLSGPFTPLFGSDEVARLREFSSVVGVALDRVRLVEALSDETDRYQALLQAVSDVGEGFLITEGERCIYANDAYLKLTGYSLDELRALPSLLTLSPPEEREAIAARANTREAQADPSDHFESTLIRKDGEVRYVEVAVKLLRLEEGRRLISVVRDITQRKDAEAALREQTEAIRLLQRVTVAANEAHELEEALQVALKEICAYSGWPVGHAYLATGGHQLIPSGIWHLDDPSRYESFKRITEETPVFQGAGLPGIVMESGRPLWVSDASTDPRIVRPLTAEAGVRSGFAFPVLVGREVAGVLEFFTGEVTQPDEDLMEVVTNIGTQLGRVVERKRLAGLRAEFISNAAHELRTPVTAILGFSSLLVDEETLSEADTRNAVAALNRQAERLKVLVNNLLDFTRMQEKRLEADVAPVRLADAVHSALEAVPVPEGKRVVVEASPQLMVMADKFQLEQILTNLIVNALRYGGDEITVSIEEGGKGRMILAVTDNGPGVAPELSGRLFEPFSRGPTSAAAGGTGLGLAIVRMLAHAQGGDVVHKTPSGGGARFEVHLRSASEAL